MEILSLEKGTKATKGSILKDIIYNIISYIYKIIINQYEQENFRVTIILNMKVIMIKIKHYQLKNILIKLDHI